MRILHTADWHLGRVFHRVSLLSQQHAVLQQLVRLADDFRPDVVLVAGDIYDRAVPPADAVRLLDDTLMQLVVDRGIPTVVIAGNHDSIDRLAFGSRLLAQQALHVFGPISGQPRPVMLCDAHGPVQIFALPFPDAPTLREQLDLATTDHRTAMRALLDAARSQRDPSARAVVLAHALVEGGRLSESERPLVLGQETMVPPACFEGFDYVALGHLHCPQQVGHVRIQYAGSIFPYSFGEAADHKSVALVELDAAGAVRVERVVLAPPQGVRVVEGTLKQLLAEHAQTSGREDFVKARLLDDGPVVGAVNRLRDVFPNLLEVERPFVTEALTRAPARASSRPAGGALQQFAAFFEQVNGEPLSETQAAELERVVNDVVHDDGVLG